MARERRHVSDRHTAAGDPVCRLQHGGVSASRISTRSLVDHLLSTLLFIGMLVEFLLVKQAATATFFLLLVISFVDAIGGYTITMRAAQRNVLVDQVETVHRA